MKRSFDNRVGINVVAIFFACFASADPASAAGSVFDAIDSEIEAWRMAEAKAHLDKLSQRELDHPRARYLMGKLAFFEGRFADSLGELRRAIEGAKAEIGWKVFRDFVAQVERVLSGFEIETGGEGLFTYRYKKGQDSVLVSYADQVLTRQRRLLESMFGDQLESSIEVDLLPDLESLAATTGLSVEQIERTGTVGVSKYGRIMIISPNKLATGYPWLDTLAHELNHVFINRVSKNRTPVWLHEGIAKLLERFWRDERLCDLTPEEAYLLDRAAREGRLIPFRNFHPSVAHMQSQEDATLAYAQVLSFVRYLNSRFRDGWIKDLLESMSTGKKLDSAFTSISKFPIRRHYLWWRQLVSGRRQTPVPAVGLMKLRFIRGKAVQKTGLESILKVDVRRHLRLGDLLRLRGHLKAAVVEYRLAERLSASPSPEISNRLAASLLDLGDAESVVEMLPSMAELYPAHSTILVQLGTALATLGRDEEAADTLRRANAINPFHPTIHCTLADLYMRLGQSQEAAKEAEHCRLIAVRSEEDEKLKGE